VEHLKQIDYDYNFTIGLIESKFGYLALSYRFQRLLTMVFHDLLFHRLLIGIVASRHRSLVGLATNSF
jgi:hypothetical protein